MPFIPAVNGVRIQMLFSQRGQKCENVYHCAAVAPASTADLTSLAEAFKLWWQNEMRVLVAPQCSLTGIIATGLDAADSPSVEYTDGLPDAGDPGGDDLPLNVTIAVRWATAQHGRGFRGRTYHMGLEAATVTGSELNLTTRGFLTLAYNELIVDVQEVGLYNLVVASYRFNNAPRFTALMTEITGASIEQTLDSQRRRLPGRGD